ncbi:Mersacidin decarboxylase [bacterium HR41]|nr:Mersacidin decarboxylase [bacterium HR41]
MGGGVGGTSERAVARLPRALPVRRLVIASGGGIGAALMPAWAAWLRTNYAVELRFALTRSAARLVSPRALAAICGARAYVDGDDSGPVPAHLRLARFGEALIVAPATANLIGKLAAGVADDLVSTVALCFEGPTVVIPSLPPGASGKPAVLRNVQQLRADGYHVPALARGRSLATGEDGLGAMLDLPAALAALETACARARLTGVGAHKLEPRRRPATGLRRKGRQLSRKPRRRLRAESTGGGS